MKAQRFVFKEIDCIENAVKISKKIKICAVFCFEGRNVRPKEWAYSFEYVCCRRKIN